MSVSGRCCRKSRFSRSPRARARCLVHDDPWVRWHRLYDLPAQAPSGSSRIKQRSVPCGRPPPGGFSFAKYSSRIRRGPAPDRSGRPRTCSADRLKNQFPRVGKRVRLSTQINPSAARRIPPVLRTVLRLCTLCLLVSGCAGGPHVADMPHWMGGLPPGAPPRPGTPQYDAWQAERAKEAARPKTGNTNLPTR